MQPFVKIVRFLGKSSIIDVLQGAKYASRLLHFIILMLLILLMFIYCFKSKPSGFFL